MHFFVFIEMCPSRALCTHIMLYHIYTYIRTRKSECHDDVIKWRHFPRYSPFVLGIRRSHVISLHKGQWRGASMLSLIWVWINGSANNRKADDLIRHCAYHDVTVMFLSTLLWWYVCIAWGNSLVLSGSKLLLQPILFKICVIIWPWWVRACKFVITYQ